MSRFFIDRPIFAWVIAIIVMIAGALAILKLPVNQYPDVAPPAIGITASYPGASAQTVQDTVTQVVEQQLNGLDGLRYIRSESNSDGSVNIVVTFEQGVDPNTAQVQVQNKLQLATPMLPQTVQQLGIRVYKYQINFMLVATLISEDGRLDNNALGDLIVSQLQDPLSRTSGVGDFYVLGAQNAMRVWLDPIKLNNYKLMPSDVMAAIQAQNVQVSSGQLGGRPSADTSRLNATVIGKTLFTRASQFQDILLKVNPDGSRVLLKDVGNVMLGSDNYDFNAKLNGHPSAGIALRLATGANTIDAVSAVRSTLDQLAKTLPPGVKVVYPYDTAPVVKESIKGVVHTLVEAIVLVFLIMFLFLQNWRATLIPTLAVPVVLLGTFGIMSAFGFTINILTMFGLVLAIGLLVDDAIVVVENVERILSEEDISAVEATRKSMDQISGALVGIGLVLSAVFIPMAFFGGSTGVIYRQFSLTIVSAMALSVLTALIFTPALCATLLKPVGKDHHDKNGFFGWFNRVFEKNARRYENGVSRVITGKRRYLMLFLFIVVALAVLFPRLPTSFLPDEDQGTMVVQAELPANATMDQTDAVLDKVQKYFAEQEKDNVQAVFAVSGFSFAGRGQNSALAFVQLKPWDERKDTVFDLQRRAMDYFGTIKEARVLAFAPPAIMELGNATGFDVFLQDFSGHSHAELMKAKEKILSEAAKNPALSMVRANGKNDEPQYKIEIDDEKASTLGVNLDDINTTMSAAWGSSFVNNFLDRGRIKRVYIQGQPQSRITEKDFSQWYVRNSSGEMVSFASFASGKWEIGSPKLERYNGVPAVELLGQPSPGYSSGDAMAAMEDIAKDLPSGMKLSWTGLSYEERSSGSQAPALYALSIIAVFLCLAALYESWSVPFSVILVIPLGVIGTVVATMMRGLENDVFFQIGLLTTVGLSAKNAILIVEFAKELYEKEGRTLSQAAIEAARLRLRPIIMTSLAFTMGVIPLLISSGASSGSKHAIGTGVVGGMVTATFLAIFFIPLFYVLVNSLKKRKNNTDT
ncbi:MULTISPECIES: efflux RND transporter permease subunit [Enterobacterales]|uniref:Efflux pump membrane transporter n=1 Tax=Mixta theicola TaxID=1458355 RepID=A0A2K1Q527_9GAMM|nr:MULTISPECIES: efflux RND transporter permease subunit [Enterobacterales]EMF0765729.1 efflux RND transporter permease subunit [Klebsiella variicola]HDK6273459.1 efflux RND transporter permease subunit [Klebsiella quasipneumoniae]HDS5277111.1 efflux RND transporter permease subunit [Enterobacter hormaechei subsp. steigerwaltii]HDS9535844.1 efflux RND transporter permease subunit [Klebsiella pneumoniae subsp. pneumoniae]EIV3863194.1 efflux RND transporter permease subunit [Klebsiella pneumonia